MTQQTTEQALAKQLFNLLKDDHPELTEARLLRVLNYPLGTLHNITPEHTKVAYGAAQAVLNNSITRGLYDKYLLNKENTAAADSEAEVRREDIVHTGQKVWKLTDHTKQEDTQNAHIHVRPSEAYYQVHTFCSGGIGAAFTVTGLALIGISSYYQYLQNHGTPIPEVPVGDAMTSCWISTAVFLVVGVALVALAVRLSHRSDQIKQSPLVEIDPNSDAAKTMKTNVTHRRWAFGLSILSGIASVGCYIAGLDNLVSPNPNHLDPTTIAAHTTAALCVIAFMAYLYYAIKANPEAEVSLEAQDRRLVAQTHV